MLANQIKNLRKKAGMSQLQLAEKLNVGPSAIGMYEQGRRTPPTDTLIEMANLFEVSLDYLITGKECLHSLPSKQQISDYLPCPCKTCCFYCAKRHSKPTNDCENENLPQEKVHIHNRAKSQLPEL